MLPCDFDREIEIGRSLERVVTVVVYECKGERSDRLLSVAGNVVTGPRNGQ